MIEIKCDEEYSKMEALFEMGSRMELSVLHNFDELRRTLLKMEGSEIVSEYADRIDETDKGIKEMQQKNHEIFAALVLYKMKK